MDSFLVDEDVSYYYQDITAFSNLNIAEKALLASTQSPEIAQIILRQFKESFDDTKPESRSDAIFNSILAGSTLAVAAADMYSQASEYDEDMGFAMIDSAPIISETVAFGSSQPSSARPMARTALVGRSVTTSSFGAASISSPQYSPASPSYTVEEVQVSESKNGAVDDHDEDENATNELREKAKKLQEKIPYKFVEPTCAWKEATYHNTDDTIKVKKFWIDYLEHYLKNGNSTFFLSDSFMYSLDKLNEVLLVSGLLDLPFMDAQFERYDILENLSLTQAQLILTSVPLKALSWSFTVSWLSQTTRLAQTVITT